MNSLVASSITLQLPSQFSSLTLSTLIAGLALLAWNVVLAGWIASRTEAPRPFTSLTAFCGLMIAPAIVITVATGTEGGSRTVAGISWVLPVITVAIVAQVLYSMSMRLLSPVVALPILLYDLLVSGVAIGDFLVAQRGEAPLVLQGLVGARDAIIGMSVGRAALISPFALLVPVIAPAYPARWRLSAVIRSVIVLAATAVTTLLLIEWPRGVGAVRSYQSSLYTRMQARPLGDFAIGMRLFPSLTGSPPARAVAADLRMARDMAPEVVLVVLEREGTRRTALDSLARVLEPLRSDSILIAVAMKIDLGDRQLDNAERQQAIERVLQQIRPDVIFPALLDPIPGLLRQADPTPQWWRSVLIPSAATVERVRPRTRLGWVASRLDQTDSIVYAWASERGSPVELIGAAVFPSFSGLSAVDARLRAFDRWHTLEAAKGGAARPHWLATVGGLPHAHGDNSQLAAIRRSLGWGSRQPWINAVIIGVSGDYDGWLGLRASNGRNRGALAELTRAAQRMREQP